MVKRTEALLLEEEHRRGIRDRYPEYFCDNWWGDGPMPERHWSDEDWKMG